MCLCKCCALRLSAEVKWGIERQVPELLVFISADLLTASGWSKRGRLLLQSDELPADALCLLGWRILITLFEFWALAAISPSAMALPDDLCGGWRGFS